MKAGYNEFIGKTTPNSVRCMKTLTLEVGIRIGTHVNVVRLVVCSQRP